MGNNLLVYRDQRYPTAFIDKDLPGDITTFLIRQGFREVNAGYLRDEMLSLVHREKERTIVVFAQDIVPDTVIDDLSASALIRRYLDCGGSIIWFGDIPCFYKGVNYNETTPREDIWKLGAPVTILGINPFFGDIPGRQCKITNAGKEQGLIRTWTGIRPTLGKDIHALAKGEYLQAHPYATGLKIVHWWEKLARWFGFIELRLPVGLL